MAGASTLAAGLLAAPAPLMIVTDFDGTLSRDRPRSARRPHRSAWARRAAAAVAAGRASSRIGCGCSCSAVAPRWTSPRACASGGMTYLGNHGLEGGALPPRARAERLTVALDDGLAGFTEPARLLGRAVVRRLGGRPGSSSRRRARRSRSTSGGGPDGEAARALVDRAVTDGLGRHRRRRGSCASRVARSSRSGRRRPGARALTLGTALEREQPGRSRPRRRRERRGCVPDGPRSRRQTAGSTPGSRSGFGAARRRRRPCWRRPTWCSRRRIRRPGCCRRLRASLSGSCGRRRERIAAAVPVDVATPAEPMSPDVAPPLVDDRRVEEV